MLPVGKTTRGGWGGRSGGAWVAGVGSESWAVSGSFPGTAERDRETQRGPGRDRDSEKQKDEKQKLGGSEKGRDGHRETARQKPKAEWGPDWSWGPWEEGLSWGLPGKESSRKEHQVRQQHEEGRRALGKPPPRPPPPWSLLPHLALPSCPSISSISGVEAPGSGSSPPALWVSRF